MRKSIVMLAFFLSSGMLFAQNNEYDVNKSDVLILGKPSASNYKNILFPRKNIIIKRGAIADFKSLIDISLMVKNIETDKNGRIVAILVRKNGLKFFRFFTEVKADLNKAIESKELKIRQKNRQNAIA